MINDVGGCDDDGDNEEEGYVRDDMMVIMIVESCQKMMLCYIWCYTLRQARGTGVGDHYQCQACLFCHYTTHSSSYNIIIMQHHHHLKSKTKTS